MLHFKKVTLEDKELITNYYKKKNYPSAKYSFSSTFVWRNIYNIEYCEYNHFLYLKSAYHKDQPMFLLPIGTGDLSAATEVLKSYCEQEKIPLKLYGIYAPEKEILDQTFGDRLNFNQLPDESDYIYNQTDLALLAGKKFHGKRNHIARFKDLDWHYEKMTEENIPLCLEMHKTWVTKNEICPTDTSVLQETCASYQAFKYFSALGLEGGLLFQNNQLVAYTMGEPLTTDTYVVHFEKAFFEVQGAYAAINQEFVLHNMQDFAQVNREEDTGDEGLRKAKLSYHPAFLLDEYCATLKGYSKFTYQPERQTVDITCS